MIYSKLIGGLLFEETNLKRKLCMQFIVIIFNINDNSYINKFGLYIPLCEPM